jgi:predicted nucleic acid-binding Zn ribbon protein
MKQNKTETYQVCFLSTDDLLNKDKDRMNRDTLILHCLSFHLQLVIITLVSFDHCIFCPSIYGLWLPLWYLLTFALSVLQFTACDYHFGIFWPLHRLSFHLRLVITALVSFDHCIVCPSINGGTENTMVKSYQRGIHKP